MAITLVYLYREINRHMDISETIFALTAMDNQKCLKQDKIMKIEYAEHSGIEIGGICV